MPLLKKRSQPPTVYGSTLLMYLIIDPAGRQGALWCHPRHVLTTSLRRFGAAGLQLCCALFAQGHLPCALTEPAAGGISLYFTNS